MLPLGCSGPSVFASRRTYVAGMTRSTKAFLALAAIAAFGSSAHGASAATVPATTETVTLLTNATVHTYPGNSAPVIAKVADTRPLTGNPTVLPVVGTADANGKPWVRVLLPQRPDSSTGWIPVGGTRVGHTPWHVVVVRAQRRAYLYRAGKLDRTFTVIVGKPSTPTPAGQFFVAEVVHEGIGATTGPYALATSAYSNVLQEFDGGPGQVALHGVTGLAGALGTAASHGCVRFADADIIWLAAHIGAGTPINIK